MGNSTAKTHQGHFPGDFGGRGGGGVSGVGRGNYKREEGCWEATLLQQQFFIL